MRVKLKPLKSIVLLFLLKIEKNWQSIDLQASWFPRSINAHLRLPLLLISFAYELSCYSNTDYMYSK